MKTLTAEETKYVDTLNTVAGEITQRIVSACDEQGQPKYAHMFDMWKAFLGGFICRELGELTELDEEQKDLIAQYTPEAIEKLLTKVVEKEVIKTVEVPVQVGQVATTNPQTYNAPASGTGGKQERRRYAVRTRGVERKRELLPSERVAMITAFNQLQRLIDRDSTEMRQYANTLNEIARKNGYLEIFASQLSGYWSVLCKRVCGIDGDVPTYIANAIKTGKLPDGCICPQATDAFKKAILENLMQQKQEAKRVVEYQKIYRELLASNPNL